MTKLSLSRTFKGKDLQVMKQYLDSFKKSYVRLKLVKNKVSIRLNQVGDSQGLHHTAKYKYQMLAKLIDDSLERLMKVMKILAPVTLELEIFDSVNTTQS